MFDLIVIFFIIYVIYKKYNNKPQQKLTSTLQKNGFSNICIIQQNMSSDWITANFRGENYLFEVMNSGYNVSNASICTLAQYASKAHYHNVILVPGNSVILNNAKSAISEYHIKIWNINQLHSYLPKNFKNVPDIPQTNPTNPSPQITEADDPIQDGNKSNSFLENFFGNKTEKL